MSTASAATIHLDATVDASLQVIHGEVVVTDGDGLRLVDLLSQLPIPADDQDLRRTFPGDVETGWVHLDRPSDTRSPFYAILPRRAGAAGLVPGRGLFANGLWHPHPVRGTNLEVVHWDVRLVLPPGVTGVLNGTVGRGELSWTGEAERLSLAVLPKARVTRVPLPAGELVMVDQGPPRERRTERLAATLETTWPGPGAPNVVVVETPLRRRLARAGQGVLYLSDRATRLTGGLWKAHLQAVRQGLVETGLPLSDPWERGFAAAALTDPQTSGEDELDVRELLGWFAWIPQVDSLLYDGRLPFYADTFGETWPGDTVRDDAAEVVSEETPPRAVARWVDLRFGKGTARQVAERMLQDQPLDAALTAQGVPPAQVHDWRERVMALDHIVSVEQTDEGWAVRVQRPLPPGAEAPAAPVELVLGPSREVWFPAAEDTSWETVLAERPTHVQLDPNHHLPPQPRANDRWPHRWTAVAAFFPYELTLRTGRISAFAAVSLRRQYNTRWRYDLAAATSPRNLVSTEVGAVHYLGPLQDRRSRPLRLWTGIEAAVLDPAFRPTDPGTMAVGGSLGGSWDTRVDPEFPRRGHRLSLSGAAGAVPGSTQKWSSVGLRAVGLVPIGGRAVWATKLSGGLATGELEHRLLGLGGSSNIQGLPANSAVGTRKLLGKTELRIEAIRHASVPVPLAWGSDLQLTLGAEAGEVLTSDGPARAAGWTAGIGIVGDVLGARPSLIAVAAGHPIWWEPAPLVADAMPEIYVRFTQGF